MKNYLSAVFNNKFFYIVIGLVWIIAIFLRVESFLAIRPLWLDEVSLALNIIEKDSLLSFFMPLDYLQKAPPLFMVITKCLTVFLGDKEWVLRLLPLVCSILSIFLFYIVSAKIFNNKITVICANYLFAINFYIIYYAQEFKQYGCDLFAGLLVILMLEKLNFQNISYKKILIYSLISVILVIFSYSVLFFILAFILLNLINLTKEKAKKILIYSIPIFLTAMVIIIPALVHDFFYMNNFWGEGFLKLNIDSISHITKSNILYFFYPNEFWLVLIFGICGIALLIKEKKQINLFILTVILLSVLTSFFRIYPLFERVSLYLLPLILLIILKPMDYLLQKNKKIISALIICIYFAAFCDYNWFHLTRFSNPDNFMFQDSRTSLKLIIDNIKENETLVTTNVSAKDYRYYKRYFGFEPKEEMVLETFRISEQEYYKQLDKIDKNKSCWLYYPYTLNGYPEKPYIRKWIKDNNLQAEFYNFNRSFVIHIK